MLTEGAIALLVLSAPSWATATGLPPVHCKVEDASGFCLTDTSTGGQPSGTGTTKPGTGSADGEIRPLIIDGQDCWPTGLADPQPGKDSPLWQGHTNGAIYSCEFRGAGGHATWFFPHLYWSATPQPQPPNPAVLAQSALASMRLEAVDVGIMPEPRPDRLGVIGMPTWMWAQNPGPRTWGPNTMTATAGPYSVTATATVERVVWDMGDGTQVTCSVPGTPYQDSFGRQSSPDCGHTYTRQGIYAVKATSYWNVDWSGIGQSGTIPLELSRTVTVRMGEVQVLNR